jgi:DNA ligase (NAD+)
VSIPFLSEAQSEALDRAGLPVPATSVLAALSSHRADDLDEPALVDALTLANALYRAGFPLIPDQVYDGVFVAALKRLNPAHPFLHAVEPELLPVAKTVPLPQKMLSTDKAYAWVEVERWLERLRKAAQDLGLDSAQLQLRATPKLDGYAAFDDGQHLYTRGDGVRGQDITRAFERGLQVVHDAPRGAGPGEIVIRKSYFEQYLSGEFENSRNIQAAIIAEKNVEPLVQAAIDDGACVFYPFSQLPAWTGDAQELAARFDEICAELWQAEDFDVDGIVLEAVSEDIRRFLGATRKFHRWQIAFKANTESAQVEVLGVTPQTSRTGRISPVAELVPTRLSGATLSRATVHHYGMVKALGVGKGAVVRLVRSGLVIPKIEQVIRAVTPELPETCPSCGAHLSWEGDHLICTNTTACPAQTENTLIHFFRTLGNIDGFGPKVIERIHAHGLCRIHDIYELDVARLVSMGFGEKTAANLVQQLAQSRRLPIEDWRFLAAFGVTRLGPGNCERLLRHHALEQIFTLDTGQLSSVDGFGELSAMAMVEGLGHIRPEFEALFALDFNLERTPLISDLSTTDSPLSGRLVVFTGTLQSGSREDLERQAKGLGARVGKSVSSKTHYLITGDKVGERKLADARAKGVRILSEQAYLSLISDRQHS